MASLLLIDDDEDTRDFLQNALKERGHAVHCLERAEEGPQVLLREPFDVVLLDNKMPGMTGLEFLEALRERSLTVPVVLMTGYSTCDTAIQAMDRGAFDYVIKPSDFQGLLRELEPLIARAVEHNQPIEKVHVAVETVVEPTSRLIMVGKSRAMVGVYKLIGQFARSDDAVLILGETGTGKELVARAIHSNSSRKTRPFVALNCTALNDNLLESELFGHMPSAFTGATTKLRKGKFEHADGGTLFLDEIGDMPLQLQAKLLRVLEYQEIERVGGNESIKVNVRVLSATHRDLEAAIAAGTFRRDLFHRLNRVQVRLPPLRERPEDLPELASYFLHQAADRAGRKPPSLAECALKRLQSYPWPGNVREMQNVLYRAFGVCHGTQILPAHLDFPAEKSEHSVARPGAEAEAVAALRKAIQWAWDSRSEKVWPALRDLLERELLAFALEHLDGNHSQVADRLEMSRTTVIKRVQHYGLG